MRARWIAAGVACLLVGGTAGITMAEPVANALAGLVPYGHIIARRIDASRRDAPSPIAAGTAAVVRNTVGSGQFGPAAADFALLISGAKDDWRSSTREGEVDAALVLARQGLLGDAAGLLIDVSKRRDAIAGGPGQSGGAAGGEEAISLVGAHGETLQSLHTVTAFAESVGGVSGGRGYGIWVHPETGGWFSGFHAQETPGRGHLDYYVSGSSGPSPASVNFAVDDAGTLIQGYPGARTRTGYDHAGDRWRVADESGATLIAVARHGRTLEAPGGMRVADGATIAFLAVARAAHRLPALRPLESATVNGSCPGAMPGDLVTIAQTAADANLGLRLAGVVSAPGVLRLLIQNLGGTSLAPGTVELAAKVERFR